MDQKAKEILEKTFWSATGWRSERTISDEDKQYVVAHGLWYENTVAKHDVENSRLISLVKKAEVGRVAGNFLASLSTRNLYARSALGSFAAHLHLSQHKKTVDIHCRICDSVEIDRDFDRNVLNFERIKWGGVRHDQTFYAAFDLETTKDLCLKPLAEDLDTLKKIFAVLSSLPTDARIRDAEKGIAPLLKSNKSEREALLQILGYCGIIQPAGKLSFLDQFVAARDREVPPASKIDWNYPVSWWRGADKVNTKAIEYYFGRYLGEALI